MTIYMTSDLHVDHWFKTNQRNEDVKALSEACLDILVPLHKSSYKSGKLHKQCTQTSGCPLRGR